MNAKKHAEHDHHENDHWHEHPLKKDAKNISSSSSCEMWDANHTNENGDT